MKLLSFLFAAILTSNCLSISQGQIATNEFEKIAWIIGHWNRINIREGRSAHERWEKFSNNELIGWGISMNGTDTTFIEKLRILEKEGKLYYVADVVENPNPVFFELTDISANGFTCENPAHDFPKKIQYEVNGNTMKATTSGGGKEIVFEFKKSD